MKSINIQFTHAELVALIEIAKTADQAGMKIEGPGKWAMDRITRKWIEVSEEKAKA